MQLEIIARKIHNDEFCGKVAPKGGVLESVDALSASLTVAS